MLCLESQLPPALRNQLGELKTTDWLGQQESLVAQGIHPQVVEKLVSAGARDLLPGDSQGTNPLEPYRQLWIAAAMQSNRGAARAPRLEQFHDLLRSERF